MASRGVYSKKSPSQALLQLANLIHLLGAGARLVELVAEPVTGQLPCKLNTNDSLAKAEHLRVVALDAPLDAKGIVRRHRPDALDLVGGDGDAQAGAADEEGPVGLALGHEAGGSGSSTWVGRLVIGGVRADIGDGFYTGVLLEVGLEGILVVDAGILSGGKQSVSTCLLIGRVMEGGDLSRTSQAMAILHFRVILAVNVLELVLRKVGRERVVKIEEQLPELKVARVCLKRGEIAECPAAVSRSDSN